MLEAAAPLLEEAIVYHASAEHLEALHRMPRLRQLDVHGLTDVLQEHPPSLPEYPQHLRGGLLRIEMQYLPRDTTIALLRAHRHSLQEVRLWVGIEKDEELQFPEYCEDLDIIFSHCELKALRRLVLYMFDEGYSHPIADCRSLLAKVKAVLPGVTVLCKICDHVEYSHDSPGYFN